MKKTILFVFAPVLFFSMPYELQAQVQQMKGLKAGVSFCRFTGEDADLGGGDPDLLTRFAGGVF